MQENTRKSILYYIGKSKEKIIIWSLQKRLDIIWWNLKSISNKHVLVSLYIDFSVMLNDKALEKFKSKTKQRLSLLPSIVEILADAFVP